MPAIVRFPSIAHDAERELQPEEALLAAIIQRALVDWLDDPADCRGIDCLTAYSFLVEDAPLIIERLLDEDLERAFKAWIKRLVSGEQGYFQRRRHVGKQRVY